MTESWFGRTYEIVSSPIQDLILKTRGEIKVQIGNKFIDLVKDGKILSLFDDIFQEVSSIDEMKLPGFYFYDNTIYIKIKDTLIKLTGEIVDSKS